MMLAQNSQTVQMLFSHLLVEVLEGPPVAPWLRDLTLLLKTTRWQTTTANTTSVARISEGRDRQESQQPLRQERSRPPSVTGSARRHPSRQDSQPSDLRDSLHQRDLRGVKQSQVATQEQEDHAL